jgi:hypothetical protein
VKAPPQQVSSQVPSTTLMSSTAPVALTDAWDNALERLRVIQQGLSGVANPLPSVQRVSRLDAELLDAELVVLLREPINKALHAVVRRLVHCYFELTPS